MANATRRSLREKSRSPKKSHSRKGVKRYGRIPYMSSPMNERHEERFTRGFKAFNTFFLL